MLVVAGLSVAYGESVAVREAGFEASAGRIVCLLGRNGAGKTTLLKAVAGLLPARKGRVVLDGADVTGLGADARARLGIAYVPQGREIFPHLTVRENLEVALAGAGRRGAASGRQPRSIDEALARFPALAGILGRKGGLLSGGQQQQLALARALLTSPRVLLLDEPTEGIQPSIVLEIEAAIRALRDEGKIAIVLVEQYLDFATRLADQVHIVEKGAIVASGSPAELGSDVVRRHLAV